MACESPELRSALGLGLMTADRSPSAPAAAFGARSTVGSMVLVIMAFRRAGGAER